MLLEVLFIVLIEALLEVHLEVVLEVVLNIKLEVLLEVLLKFPKHPKKSLGTNKPTDIQVYRGASKLNNLTEAYI